jgi:hypothetical protein
MSKSNSFIYYGVLKDFNLETINRNTFPKLLTSNIFEEEELSNGYQSQEDYFGIELCDSNWGLSNFYLFNRKEYYLKKSILPEMFRYCARKCECYDSLNQKKYDLDFNLNFQISDFSKIKFLKIEIQRLYQNLEDKDYFLLYSRNKETDDFKSWFEYFESEQIENEDYTFIFKYLAGDNDFVPTSIKKMWQEYFLVNQLSEFCKKKIYQIERYSGINEADVNIEESKNSQNNFVQNTNEKKFFNHSKLTSEIFNDDSEELFEFIVNRYREEKNAAFYSYLYHFFCDKKFFVNNKKKTNIKYDNYLIKNKYIQSFSKVIQKSETDGDAAKDKDLYFEKEMKIFHSLQK